MRVVSRLVGLLLVAGVLSVGFVACGSDDEPDGGDGGAVAAQDGGGSGGGGDAGSPSGDRSSASAGSDEEQARAAVVGVQRAFVDGKPAEVCAGFSEAARKVAAVNARAQDEGSSCEDNIAAQMERRAKGSALPKIVSVELDGGRGIVKLREGEYAHEQPVVREGGVWKVEFGVDPPEDGAGAKAGKRKSG